MTIDYQDRPVFFGAASTPTWLRGELTEVDGGFVVTLPNGRILSVQPDGRYEDRDANAAGPWELCRPHSSLNVLQFTLADVPLSVVYRAA